MKKQAANQQKIGYAFIDKALETAFNELQKGRTDELELASFLSRAILDLLKNPLCGIRVPSNRWPKEYIRKHKINNLWKYDLPGGWRMLYTIHGNEVQIISVLIEWLSHKEYERRFNY
jgi:hypothetical protein